MDGSVSINQFMQNYAAALKGRYGEDAEISFGEVTPAGVSGAQAATMEVTITVNGETQVIPVEVPELDEPAPGSSELLLNPEKAEELAGKLDGLVHEMVSGTDAAKSKEAARLRDVMNCIYQVMALLLECGNMSRQITRQTRNAELEQQITAYKNQAESIRSAAREAKGIATISMFVSGGLTLGGLAAQGYGIAKQIQANRTYDMAGKTTELNLANLELAPEDAKVMGQQAMSELSPKGAALIAKNFKGTEQNTAQITKFDQSAKQLESLQGDMTLTDQMISGMEAGMPGEGGAPAKIDQAKQDLQAAKDNKIKTEGELKDLNGDLEKEAETLQKQVKSISDDTIKLNKLEAKLSKLEGSNDPRNASKISSLKQEIGKLENSIKGKTTDLNATKDKILNLEGQISEKLQSINELDGAIKQQEAFLEGAQMGGTEGAQEKLDQLKQQKSEIGQKMEDIKKQLTENPIDDNMRADTRKAVNDSFKQLELDVKDAVANGSMTKAEAAKVLKAGGLKKAEVLGRISTDKQVAKDIGDAKAALNSEIERYSNDAGVKKSNHVTAAMGAIGGMIPAFSSFFQTLAQSKVQLADAEVKEYDAMIKQEEIQLNDSDQLFQNALKVFQAALEALKEVIRSMVELEKSVSRSFA